MKQTFYKIILYIFLFAAIVVFGYVVMNSSYFLKQLKFSFRGHTPPSQHQDDNGTTVKGEPNHLSIPSLGIEAPIVDPARNTEKDFQEGLKQGVVHYPGTANVGEVGNPYIFGHSSDFAFKAGSFKTVFALLPKIHNGAEVFVTNTAGDKFTYKVVSQKVVASNDTTVLNQETNGAKLLTLQTSYPVGTALKRYIVIAQLVE